MFIAMLYAEPPKDGQPETALPVMTSVKEIALRVEAQWQAKVLSRKIEDIAAGPSGLWSKSELSQS